MRCRSIALAATMSVAWCGTVWADEASEKALEQKLVDMQRQLDEMSRRMGDGSNRSEDELEQRIAEMEKITKKDQDGLFAYYKNGLKLDSVDGAFKVSIFGRVQNDYTFWDSEEEVTDELGETNVATEFRRARLGMQVLMFKNVVGKFEMDWANGVSNFADAFVQVNSLVPGADVNLRVGHYDEPFGLDRVTSSKYGTFTERGLQEALVPARNTGVMLLGQAMENRLAWFAGFFRDANGAGDDVGNANKGEHNFTARVTGRPYVSEDGTQFVHLGIAGSARNPSNETVQFRSRPEVHTGPQFVDTGALTNVDTAGLLGLEAAGVFGPFSIQAEHVRVGTESVDGDGDDLTFDSTSVQISFFLTGENREYETAGGRFDRVKVKKNFGSSGTGAFEVALRYSTLDLDDGDVEGGELTDWTLGFNWYLNPNTRFMLDVIRAKRSDLPSIVAVTASVRIDF